MANYGLNYISEFDSIVEDRYRVEIYRKEYSGPVQSMVMSTPPATLSCTTDDPKAPIKGQALELRIVNTGSLPITNFYSDDDTAFRAHLIWKQLLSLQNKLPISATAGVISVFGYDFTSILPYLKTISIGGNTYTITSSSISGINAFVFNTASTYSQTFASTAFTINYEIDTTQFIGFINQDDSSEILVDFEHEIVLTCNDGLALLQNTAFNNIISGLTSSFFTISRYEPVTVVITTPNIITLSNTNFQPSIGDLISFKNTNIDGQYTVVDVVYSGPVILVGILETVPIVSPSTGLVYLYQAFDFAGKNSIASIIYVCLYQTGMQLNTNLFFNIFETTFKKGQSPLYQTFIDCNMFQNDDGSFKSCYDVLTACMLNTMTLIQSFGEWWCIRWDELRYSGLHQNIWKYDTNGLLLSVTSGGINQVFNIGPNKPQVPENGILRQIKRPYQYVKRTFNYQEPKSATKNLDLQTLGAFIRQYTEGTGIDLTTTIEYQAPFINHGTYYLNASRNLATNGPDPYSTNTINISIFIRIINDYLGRELDRYLVVSGFDPSIGNILDNIFTAMFLPVEITKGDVVRWGFSIKKSVGADTSGPSGLFSANLLSFDNGDFTKPRQSPLTTSAAPTGKTIWAAPGAFEFLSYTTTGDLTQWQGVSFGESLPSPKDGLLYLYMAQIVLNTGTTFETHYKDFSIQIDHFINQSLKITGQINNTQQNNVIKNNEDITISVDDSPANSIAGTLFCSYIDLDSRITRRTINWYRDGFTEQRRLNDILTFEELFYKRTARPELDGTLFGLTDSGKHLSILSIILPVFLAGSGINVMGQISIDYHANECKATFYELFKQDDPDSALTSKYDFTYIYSTQ